MRQHALHKEVCGCDLGLIKTLFIRLFLAQCHFCHLGPEERQSNQGKKFEIFTGRGASLIGVFQACLGNLAGGDLQPAEGFG